MWRGGCSTILCCYNMEKMNIGRAFVNFFNVSVSLFLRTTVYISSLMLSAFVLFHSFLENRKLLWKQNWGWEVAGFFFIFLTTSTQNNSIVLRNFYLQAVGSHSSYFFSSSDLDRLSRGGPTRHINVYFETACRAVTKGYNVSYLIILVVTARIKSTDSISVTTNSFRQQDQNYFSQNQPV